MLKTLKIKGTEDQPEVIFDIESKIFKISGRSLPEDSFSFYKPLIEWMDEYVQVAETETHIQIYLEYLNSSSVKQVFFLLSKLETLNNKGREVKIFWNYQKGDDLMKTKCMEFKRLLTVPLEMIEHEKMHVG